MLCAGSPEAYLDLSSSSDDSSVNGNVHGAAHNLYLPAPGRAHGQEAREWHLVTRNVFAWIMNKPLIGQTLTLALIDLVERLHTLRPASMDSVRDVLAYATRMGYTDMTNCANHSLAMLNFAEHFHIPHLWREAFVHCAGQNEVLYLSPEYKFMTKKTQANITRAYLRMDLRLVNVSRVLGNFLESDTDSAKLGLSPSQRSHLDRFRSFLHSHYVARLGYWPPMDFSRDFLEEMHYDMTCLYNMLADKSSVGNRAASGGLCTLQTGSAYDQNHEYLPQDHLTPLLPRDGALTGKALQVKQFRLSMSTKNKRRNLLLTTWANLLQATNKLDRAAESNSLVKSYRNFEQESLLYLEPDLSISDARKVRWILIYYLLQTLSAVMPSPFVSDPDRAEYHTCALVPDIPWTNSRRMSSFIAMLHPAEAVPMSPTELFEPDEIPTPPDASPLHTLITVEPSPSSWSIRPDCEDDDYFAPKRLPQRDTSLRLMPRDSVRLTKRDSYHASQADATPIAQTKPMLLRKSNSFALPSKPPRFGRSASTQVTRRHSTSGRNVLVRRASASSLTFGGRSNSKRLSGLFNSTLGRRASVSRDDALVLTDADIPQIPLDPLRGNPRTPTKTAADFIGPFELDATDTARVPFVFTEDDRASLSGSLTNSTGSSSGKSHDVSTPGLTKSDVDSMSDYDGDMPDTSSDEEKTVDSPLAHRGRSKKPRSNSVLTCETEWDHLLESIGGSGRRTPLLALDTLGLPQKQRRCSSVSVYSTDVYSPVSPEEERVKGGDYFGQWNNQHNVGVAS